MKATKVDGIYSADPKKDPNAVRYDSLTYLDVLSRDLKVMDAAAISLARENHIPVIVFNLQKTGAIFNTLCGHGLCTLVTE
jgi:uridylate kinase